MDKGSFQDPGALAARETGRGMEDRAMFEVNMAIGSFSWANDYALRKLGYSSETLRSMSVFDLSPEQFHEKLRADMAELDGKPKRFSVRPMRAATGSICWWYIYQIKSQLPVQWLYAEHIQDTPTSGAEFSFMSMQMDTVNSQAALEARMEDLDDWVREQVGRVDGEVSQVRAKLDDVLTRMEHVKSAARTAADNSLDAKNASKAVQTELNEQFKKMEDSRTEHAMEILKLISNDSLHDKRIQTFEDHVKNTTELAVRAIEIQADKAGKGLTKKVTIPVGVIAGIAAMIQLVIQHWAAIVRMF